MSNHRLGARAFIGTALLLASYGASAEVVAFNFDTEFSTGTTPVGPGPWLSATFADIAPDTVSLVVSTTDLSGNESIKGLYFNLDPTLNATTLTFVRDSASTGPSAATTTINLGTNAYQADGDGLYDVYFDLPPPPGSQPARFGANETLIYTNTGTGLSASSFFFLSQPNGGSRPFYAAAHVLQIGPNSESAWVAPVASVPVPGALVLLLSGLGLLPVARKRLALAASERA